jgi:hypothetical protein
MSSAWFLVTTWRRRLSSAQAWVSMGSAQHLATCGLTARPDQLSVGITLFLTPRRRARVEEA